MESPPITQALRDRNGTGSASGELPCAFEGFFTRTSARRAFSLVEVTLALGIMSVMALALVGMVPVGMQTFSKSINTTVESLIAQQLFTVVQQTSFARIREDNGGGQNPSGDYYFDQEGFPASASNFVYQARVTVPKDGGARLVPSSASAATNANLRTVTIEIAKNRTVDAVKGTNATELQVFTYLTADIGL